MSVVDLPWGDWQFYATTALAVGGLWLLLRPRRPSPTGTGTAPPCNHCANGACGRPAGEAPPSRLRVLS